MRIYNKKKYQQMVRLSLPHVSNMELSNGHHDMSRMPRLCPVSTRAGECALRKSLYIYIIYIYVLYIYMYIYMYIYIFTHTYKNNNTYVHVWFYYVYMQCGCNAYVHVYLVWT
jgi:hypothetical protein